MEARVSAALQVGVSPAAVGATIQEKEPFSGHNFSLFFKIKVFFKIASADLASFLAHSRFLSKVSYILRDAGFSPQAGWTTLR